MRPVLSRYSSSARAIQPSGTTGGGWVLIVCGIIAVPCWCVAAGAALPPHALLGWALAHLANKNRRIKPILEFVIPRLAELGNHRGGHRGLVVSCCNANRA